MSVIKKRYYQGPDVEATDPKDREKVVWFCETSVYHPDTQNTSTAWVGKVSDDEVPQVDKDVAAAKAEAEKEEDDTVTKSKRGRK